MQATPSKHLLPIDFLVPALLIPLLPVPLMAAAQVISTFEWSDAITATVAWLVFPVCYWWPIGLWLFRGAGGWFTRLLVGYLLSLPLYLLCLFVIYPAFGYRFAPGARGLWGVYLSASPWFFVYVYALYRLVRRVGRLARAVCLTAIALFAVALVAPFALLLAIDSFRPATQADAPSLIVGARIVDVEHGRLLDGMNVHLANGRISSIIDARADTGVDVVPGRTIDAKGAFLVPGLLDVHSHIQAPVESTDAGFSIGYAAGAMFGRYASQRRQYLSYGITGVRDLGGPAQVTHWMRDELAAHRLAGPRLFIVGRLITSPAGHPVATIWTKQQARSGAIEATDKAMLAREIQADVDSVQPDAIKIIYGTIGRAKTRLSRELLQEAIGLASKHGRMSIVHAERTEEVRAAAQAGATGIEHVASIEDLPDDLLALMIARRPFVDPTFGELRAALRLGGATKDTIDSSLARARWTIKRLFDAGVPLVVGTDAPLVGYGTGVHDELVELQRAGIAPADVLRMVTMNNAAYLGQSQTLGRIAPGFLADLILVADNPLDGVDGLRSPVWTMVDGSVLWKKP